MKVSKTVRKTPVVKKRRGRATSADRERSDGAGASMVRKLVHEPLPTPEVGAVVESEILKKRSTNGGGKRTAKRRTTTVRRDR